MKISVKCNNDKCFANVCSYCRVLESPIAVGKPCPFYKTEEEVKLGRQKTIERLQGMEQRGQDLLNMYTYQNKGYAL